MFSHKFNNKNYHINKLYFNWKTVMLLNLCTQIRLSSLFIMWFEMKWTVFGGCVCKCVRVRSFTWIAHRTQNLRQNEQNRQWLLCLYLFNINDISFRIMMLRSSYARSAHTYFISICEHLALCSAIQANQE